MDEHSSDEELLRRRQAGVHRFALHMSGSQATAEDVTQEVFLALMRDAARFDPRRGTLAAVLYGIARNHVPRSANPTIRCLKFPPGKLSPKRVSHHPT